jgi:hypothetical protein
MLMNGNLITAALDGATIMCERKLLLGNECGDFDIGRIFLPGIAWMQGGVPRVAYS